MTRLEARIGDKTKWVEFLASCGGGTKLQSQGVGDGLVYHSPDFETPFLVEEIPE